jgi:cysteine-rich repeat protein
MLSMSLVLLLWAGSASAQINCSGGCTTTTYGLGNPNDVDFRKSPNNARAFLASDFQGSYFFIRSNPANAAGIDCGIDRDYTPVQGRILLKEQNGCVPTSTGPTCTAGTNVGAVCHLPLGQSTAANTIECGTGGTCAIAAGTSCPVEIPLTNNTTPFAQRSEVFAPIWSKSPPGVGGLLDLLSTTSFALSGSSSSDPQDDCLPSFIRTVPSQGQRYLLPASRGGNPTDPNPAARKTFIRWNEDVTGGSALYRHNDDGVVCCNSTATLCTAVGPFSRYPVLNRNGCEVSSSSNPGVAQFVQTPDWVFNGGPGTFFQTDSEFVVPGQVGGVCRVNRDKGCTTQPQPPTGTHPLGINCATVDADPNTAGLQPDTCDFREPGTRTTRPGTLPNGYPITDRCANSFYVLRGTPSANCYITERYAADGDPGPDCDVVNFGVRTRADFDCNGVPDSTDLCPLLNEFDHLADTDGDCAGSPAQCRGDECECGDQNLDGRVNVQDLVAINAAIFTPSLVQELCDTNLDDLCNVSDIVGANREIFVPGSSVCSHVTTLNCGDGFLDPNEECDDGNRFAGDGCSPICRNE